MKLFLISGFLGSGKTTAIKESCAELLKRNTKVAVITNDQGADLVDTVFIRNFGIPAEEVPNGCFCCNFKQLEQSIALLHRTDQPEIIFAESVGSCTDLIATVAKPLAKFYPEIETAIVAFADASLLCSLISGTSSFLNDEVRYIYKNQLAEADVLVVNKIDLIRDHEMAMIQKVISQEYADKVILHQNSLQKADIRQWLKTIMQFRLNVARKSLALNYDVYAEGEAMLAWLDELLSIQTTNFKACEVALNLVSKITSEVRSNNYTIGHLKFLIDDGEKKHKISFTTNDKRAPNLFPDPARVNHVTVLINARVQTTSNQLKAVVDNALKAIVAQTNCKINIKSISSFQPSYPRPTYRIVE